MKEMICIICPLGCHLSVDDSDSKDIKVTGNNCNRGIAYAKAEIINPLRTVTSIVSVKGGDIKMVSVKTTDQIPKKIIFTALELLKDIEVEAPIYLGDVIIKNICDTGVDFIATKTVLKCNNKSH